MRRLIISHGKHGNPQSKKIQKLAQIGSRHGYEVIIPDYRGIVSPDLRTHFLKQRLGLSQKNDVLVGSSMGAYVSIIVSKTLRPKGLFLLSPALGILGYQDSWPKACASKLQIIHGVHDTQIPIENIYRWIEQQSLPWGLQIVKDSHDLRNHFDTIGSSFDQFLRALDV